MTEIYTTETPYRSVAIVSGGLDSTVLAYMLHHRGDELHLLSFDYGQKHSKELGFAAMIGHDLSVDHVQVDLRPLNHLISGSVLTAQGATVPEGHYASDNMKATVVPNRNAIMLAIAYGWAINLGTNCVATGIHSGDHPIYPDCRPEFVLAFELMEKLANQGFADPTLQLYAPFQYITKSDIVRIGHSLGVPWEKTWSCYVGGDVHCSKCGTCVERRLAFAEAGVTDPTPYALSWNEFREWTSGPEFGLSLEP